MKKIGLCLAGGGARGIVHVGVLRAFEEADIPIHSISGASMGAIVGALYASGKTVDEIYALAADINLFRLVKFGLPISSLGNLDYMKQILDKAIETQTFEGLKKKLYVCISNLNTTQFEIVSKGNLHEVVLASAAIPMVFEPVKINGSLCVDGGLLNNFPVEPLRASCDVVIGINVNPHEAVVEIEGIFNNIKSVGERCFDLVLWQNTKDRLKQCDIVIEPKKMWEHNIFDFPNYETIYQKGYEAAQLSIEAIKKLI